MLHAWWLFSVYTTWIHLCIVLTLYRLLLYCIWFKITNQFVTQMNQWLPLIKYDFLSLTHFVFLLKKPQMVYGAVQDFGKFKHKHRDDIDINPLMSGSLTNYIYYSKCHFLYSVDHFSCPNKCFSWLILTASQVQALHGQRPVAVSLISMVDFLNKGF